MKKSEIYGLIGSAISTALLILLLFLIVLPGLKTPEDEGIMVSFGETFDGGGVTQTPTPKAAEPSSPPPTTPKPQKQDLMTQDDNSFAINEQKKKDKQAKEALEKQKKEEARIAAEKNRKEQDAINKANMDGLFGSGGSTGSGNTSGNTNQGNPAGKGSSGGNSWSLNGRSLSGRLVSPRYDNDVEGKITVNIRVDSDGNVISTSIGSPTNISDQGMRNAAMSAAKSTKFTSGSGDASGSITYNFKLT